MEPNDLILIISQALVDNPEQVSVNEIESNNAAIIELAVAKSEIGKILGKEGRTVNAIRSILNAMDTPKPSTQHPAFNIADLLGSSFPESGRYTKGRSSPSDERGIWENNIGFL